MNASHKKHSAVNFKRRFKLSAIQMALLAVVLGTTTSVTAVTNIVTDTDISTGTEGEVYYVSQGATLTGSGAKTGQIILSPTTDFTQGNLKLNNGSVIDGSLLVQGNSHAELTDTTVTGIVSVNSGSTGGASLSLVRSTLEDYLGVSKGTVTVSESNLKQLIMSEGGSASLVDSQLYNDSSDPYVVRSAGILGLGESALEMTGGSVYGNTAISVFNNVSASGTANFLFNGTLLESHTGPVLQIGFDSSVGSNAGSADITLAAGTQVRTADNTLMSVQYGSDARLTLDASNIQGDIIADSTSTADVTLRNSSRLSGSLSNVSSLTLDGSSLYEVTAGSDVGTLNLGGGTVSFASSTDSGFRTLTTGTLNGGGTIAMNTDVAGMQGDFLDVTGNASGSYSLSVANSGREPVSTDALLALVRTGGGDATFGLKNGAVDIGAWQYQLARYGNEWGLVQTGKQPVVIVDPIFPDQPPVTVTPIEGGTGPVTSASTDAVINMASAAKYAFYGEMNAVKAQEGVWSTVLGGKQRVQSAWDASFDMTQQGVQVGAGHTVATAAGDLTAGAYFSYSNSQVKNARGGTGHIDSTGGGVYGLLNAGNGWYAQGVLQVDSMDNRLSARMADGAGVSGNWRSTGYGMHLEGGRQLEAGLFTVTPWAGISGFRNTAKDITLSNDLRAQTGNGSSLRAETGVRLATDLSVGRATVTPSAGLSIHHEFAGEDAVTINDSYRFGGGADRTAGSLNAGVGVKLGNTRLWVDAAYGKGDRSESPITGRAGFSVAF